MSILKNFFTQVSGPAEAPKLVFLHGVMGFGLNWRRIAKAFEDRFHILTYDQRGHGRSFHPERYSSEDYASDLEKILDELGWREIHLVGHSMGGRVAMHFGATRPKRVTRLVIEDAGPSPSQGASLALNILESVPVPFPDKKSAKIWFETEFVQIFSSNHQAAGLADFLYANLTENEKKEAVWRFSVNGVRESISNVRNEDRTLDIASLDMPTLFIRGEKSQDLTREMLVKLHRMNPLIQAAEIKGAGHWVHSEQPEAFTRLLDQFLTAKNLSGDVGIEVLGFDKNP